MEIFKIENLTFAYPNSKKKALKSINMSVHSGEFLCICGKSGCGKTTLLRLLKTAISPFGEKEGSIFYKSEILDSVDHRTQSGEIGFVMQNPDSQIVTDKVWHELAFGLESLGYDNSHIRAKVAEIAAFFGIEDLFHKKVSDLSGGQKQLLNLASVMVTDPGVLILDEPTSQLDPVSAHEFLKALEKINRELGTTVILSEHRLEEAFPLCTRVIVMEDGKIIADGSHSEIGQILKETDNEMQLALPTPQRVWSAVENNLPCPVSVKDARLWLCEMAKTRKVNKDAIKNEKKEQNTQTVIEIKEVYFRYEKVLPDVIKNFNLEIKSGELFCILGGNGAGKSTALSLISGINTPYRGSIRIFGKKLSQIPDLYTSRLGILPQNPHTLFVKNTVAKDLKEVEKSEEEIEKIARICRITHILDSNPYDLSGGEVQRAALAKVLLKKPQILLLDEPTKGMDACFKEEFAQVLTQLKADGVTVVMVSHDVEFCAKYADRCALFFDGAIASLGTPRKFFSGNTFYTTAASRMARAVLPEAILAEDIICALGGKLSERKQKHTEYDIPQVSRKNEKQASEKKKINPFKIAGGVAFLVLFVITYILGKGITETAHSVINQLLSLAFAAGAAFCFLPKKEFDIQFSPAKKKGRAKTLAFSLLTLLAVGLTVFLGATYFEHRKYYLISLLIILETLISFFSLFEGRTPKSRELVTISVICAIGVVGRSAFFALPQFKPVGAIVMIAGICFGAQNGFLVGAITAFVSNFFFGQTVLTPWQMVAFGLVGFISGLIFSNKNAAKNKLLLSITGALLTFFVYGVIMNCASVITWEPEVNLPMLITSVLLGMPFDLIHALSTALFLWFIAEPMIEKIERIKTKYGIMQ